MQPLTPQASEVREVLISTSLCDEKASTGFSASQRSNLRPRTGKGWLHQPQACAGPLGADGAGTALSTVPVRESASRLISTRLDSTWAAKTCTFFARVPKPSFPIRDVSIRVEIDSGQCTQPLYYTLQLAETLVELTQID